MTNDINGINAELAVLLLKKGLYISSAESCTGGLFSAYLTAVPGASEVFKESIVTYSNEAKMRELGVKAETLSSVGAVSAETAKEMAQGIRRHTGADIGVGITGIAGPGGGTAEKPVGTVYICVSSDLYEKTELLKSNSTDREGIRRDTCIQAFRSALKAAALYPDAEKQEKQS